jgi:hypothetical protein
VTVMPRSLAAIFWGVAFGSQPSGMSVLREAFFGFPPLGDTGGFLFFSSSTLLLSALAESSKYASDLLASIS